MFARRVFLAGAITAAVAPAVADPPPASAPPPLDTLRPLSARTLSGEATTLGAHLGEGAAMISFWATWCSACIYEGRHLAQWRARTPVESLSIVGVNMDRERDRTERRLTSFMRRGRMNYTQLLGDLAMYRAFDARLLGNNQISLPRLYIFAAGGRPVAAFDAFYPDRTPADIDQALTAALEG